MGDTGRAKKISDGFGEAVNNEHETKTTNVADAVTAEALGGGT